VVRPRWQPGDASPTWGVLSRGGASFSSDPGCHAVSRRVAFVSGSSRGLGRHIAVRLARDGLSVAVNGLHDDGQAAEVAAEIRGQGGVADSFSGDVTDEGHVRELVWVCPCRLRQVRKDCRRSV